MDSLLPAAYLTLNSLLLFQILYARYKGKKRTQVLNTFLHIWNHTAASTTIGRFYCNGILTKVAPATRDAESGLYCSERIEVPCRRGDALWLTIAYQDTQNIECEVTLGRWEITDNGDVQRKPELAQDIYPTLTWPEENNKTA